MKTMYKVKKTVIFLFAGFIVACGAETVAAIIFLPAFAADWPVVGDNDYEIELRPNADNMNVESGIFPGEERHFSNPDRNENVLSGSFDGLYIEFTIQRLTGSVQYTGRMIPVSDTDHTITRIELTSSEGDLVLGQ